MSATGQQLRAAASKGNAERVKALLAQGVDANALDAKGNSALKLAVTNGHVDAVDVLLIGGATLAAEQRSSGLSVAAELLVRAAELASGGPTIDRLLAALGADERARALREANASGWTVLHLAAQAGSRHLLQLALGAGAQVDALIPALGATALMIAVQGGRADVVDALLGARTAGLLACADVRGWSALHWAAQLGETAIVGALIAAGAPLEACADGVGTPLMVAAENAHPDVVGALLAAGSVVGATDQEGWCALTIAAGKGHAPIVERLLAAKADVNQCGTSSKRTALMAAAQSGHAAVAALLVGARAHVNALDAGGVSALLLAAKNGHGRLVELLLAAGATADAADAAGQTALVLNARSGDVAIAALLLRHGAHADHVTRAGVTALALAAKHGHRELIEMLIRAGTSHAGQLLMQAAASAQMDVLLALLKAGGGLIDVDVLGSALLTAAAHGQRSAVSVLVNAGASVFKQDAAGLSPLMLAAANGHMEAARALIKANAPVNAPGGPGANTALSVAVRNGRADVVAELLRHGANVEWRGSGERPFDLLELSHDAQVRAQIVAERQRRDLERELLSVKEEASARMAKRKLAASGKKGAAAHAAAAPLPLADERAPPPTPRTPDAAARAAAAAAQRADATADADAADVDASDAEPSPLDAPSPRADDDGTAAAAAAAANEPAAAAAAASPLAAPPSSPRAPEADTAGAPADKPFAPLEVGVAAGEDLWRYAALGEPQGGGAFGAAPGACRAAPTSAAARAEPLWPAAGADDESEPARFCRACNMLAFQGHRCRSVADGGAPPSLAARVPAEPPSWRGARAGAQPTTLAWRKPALGAGALDGGAGAHSSAPLSLESLSQQTAAMAEQARAESGGGAEHMLRHAQPVATRRSQSRVAGLGAAGLQQVVEMQMDTVRRLEEQTRLEKQKLLMLLDLQAQLSSLS
jgi:ankyrin repeat protein